MNELNQALFRGQYVYLSSEDPQVMAEHSSRWQRSSEYWRLLTSDPNRLFSRKKMEEWFEESIEKEAVGETQDEINFAIRRLEDDRLIGNVALDGIDFQHGSAFTSIGIGEPEHWGRGYGTDAMKVLLRYAFEELNLERVSLTVFEYNPRALRSYQKVGFVEEGRYREFIRREGRRWDMIFMGITRKVWQNSPEQDRSNALNG